MRSKFSYRKSVSYTHLDVYKRQDKYSVYRLGSNKGFRTVGAIGEDLDLFRICLLYTSFCSMCGPKFCSMNWSSKVDKFNEQEHGLKKPDLTQIVTEQLAMRG